ncbi:hypothetical protein Taro_034420 [Colocasia esculenta]|uniref:Histidinol dehydrogenase, chloroplastic n=1 Tax=Colocasia esculenta TaxID=4460 RepID=A0A843WBW2_COLES|nr:hypothetical protein [Colocasia esculenta]
MKGVRCKRVARCISSVGLYVPGGTAVLPSTALMLSVPAQIAGCKIVVLATPPGRDGSICKEVLYCAKKAGVTHILKAGGAQAVSAMAWGTSSCPKVCWGCAGGGSIVRGWEKVMVGGLRQHAGRVGGGDVGGLGKAWAHGLEWGSPAWGMGSARPVSMAEQACLGKVPQSEPSLKCPFFKSTNTKFCYFNNKYQVLHGWALAALRGVEKIFGPGNQYVTAAKMILQNSEAMVSIDMPAGPSEVLVIADKHANPVHIAADLLSQAEHGPDSQVVLVIAGDGVDVDAIEEEISKQCASLPRAEFASKALSHSFIVFARDMIEAISFSNLYAPEHLIINVKDADKWEEFIENAGSVFLGQWSPESVGDYASGTNHVLPTYGYARMYGGVSLDSFVKHITVQSLTEEGLRSLGPHVAKLAEVEGLEAHKRAVTLRLQDIEAALPK